MAAARSWLFVPGSNPRALAKAPHTGADAVVMDLEDSVPLGDKAAARAAVAAALAEQAGAPAALWVRINPLRATGPYTVACGAEDLAAVVVPGLAGVLLPKAEAAADVQAADRLLAELERARGLAPGSVGLIPVVESARALWDAAVLGTAAARVRRFVLGSADFTADIGTEPSRTGEELAYARSRLVVASRVAGLEPPLDTAWFDVHDAEGLAAEARLARRLGFSGKFCIHPAQVPVVNAAFTPSAAEVAGARRLLAAFAEAERAGRAAILLDGRMVDYAMVVRARRLLAAAGIAPEEQEGGEPS